MPINGHIRKSIPTAFLLVILPQIVKNTVLSNVKVYTGVQNGSPHQEHLDLAPVGGKRAQGF